MANIKKISRWAVPMAIMVFLPVLVYAQLLPTVPVTGTAVDLEEIKLTIEKIATFLVVVSIIIAIIFIVLGGIMYMAARGNEDMVKQAKATIKNGVIGALVALAVGVILNTLAGLVARTFFS